jgi:ApaG protein
VAERTAANAGSARLVRRMKIPDESEVTDGRRYVRLTRDGCTLFRRARPVGRCDPEDNIPCVKPPSFYYRESNGIRVTVRPVFLPAQSQPAHSQFVFAYFVRLENIGEQSAQLLSRRWLIHDSVGEGENTEVEGEGVVGEIPVIAPGHIHEYQSFCVLKSPFGYMEGEYLFRRADRTRFAAEIPRFALDAQNALGPTS